MKLRYVTAASLLGAAGLLLSSCSSSGGTKASSTGPTSSAPVTSTSVGGPSASGEPIVIGSIMPTGAPFYNTADTLAAARAAVSSINKAGGVKGRPLKLDWCNESNDPNKGKACARQMVSDHVIATVGNLAIGDPGGIASVLDDGKVAQVQTSESVPAEFNSPYIFPIDPPGAWTSAAVSGWAVQNADLKKIAIVTNENPLSIAFVQVIKSAIENAGGSVPKTVLIPPQEVPDWSPYAQQVIASKAQAVMIPVTTDQALRFVKALRALGGKDITVLASTGEFSNEDLTENAAALNGSYIGLASPWTNDAAQYPVLQKFMADMAAAKAAGDGDADVNTARQPTFGVWSAVYAIKQILDDMVASKTEINTANFLAAIKGATIDRGIGFSWKPGQPQTKVSGYPNISATLNFIEKAEDGKWVLAQKEPVDTLTYLAP